MSESPLQHMQRVFSGVEGINEAELRRQLGEWVCPGVCSQAWTCVFTIGSGSVITALTWRVRAYRGYLRDHVTDPHFLSSCLRLNAFNFRLLCLGS